MSIKEFNQKGLGSYINLEKYGLTAFQLKMIAVLAMVIDHVGIVFLAVSSGYYHIFRAIGRLSFPIFAFLIVEGFFHTSSRKKYAIRLGIFAMISEIPYDLAFHVRFIGQGQAKTNLWYQLKELYFSGQNVFFTLFIGMVAIWALHSITEGKVKYPQILLHRIGFARLQSFTKMMIMISACGLGYLIKGSYSYGGVFLILCFYVFYEHHLGKVLANIFFDTMLFDGNLQWYGVFSVIPIAFYSRKPGQYKWKWFFYWFYPAHLFFLAVVQAGF